MEKIEETQLLNSFFAKRILKHDYREDWATFLKTLMQKSREGELFCENEGPPLPEWITENGLIVREKNRYYLKRNWLLENQIAEEIERLSQLPTSPITLDFEGIPLLSSQKKGIERSRDHPFSILSGGPGTGKSYTAAHWVRLFLKERPQARVVLAAPTGKAAAHLQSLIGLEIEAMTLHRLLKVRPGKLSFSPPFQIDAELVIVDEASMIALPLLLKLLSSIGKGTRLLLLGDPDQLPPVEAGSLFRELAQLFGTPLEKSMRSNNEAILQLGEQINRGEWSRVTLDWKFDPTLTDKLYQKLEPLLFSQKPSPEELFKRLRELRILGALRQGPFGIDRLNDNLLEKMTQTIRPGEWWAIPILITTNQPERNLYNGTVGILIGQSRGGIDLSDGIGYFPDPLPYRNIPSFELSFCLSIHKSQGSEFDQVVALFPEGSDRFGKEALYTAVTRAKKKIDLVGDPSVIEKMVQKNCLKPSSLKERLEAKRGQPKV